MKKRKENPGGGRPCIGVPGSSLGGRRPCIGVPGSSLGGGGPSHPILGAHYKTRRRWTTMYWRTGTVYPPPAARLGGVAFCI